MHPDQHIVVTCNNCHQQFTGKYCSHCGQKATAGKLSLHEVWHDLVHAFVHADKGILRLSIDIMIRPAKVYHGYFKGKRKTYFSPVMFFLLLAGIYVIMGEKLWDWEDHITGRHDEFGRLLHRLEKERFLIFMPVISLITWGLFYKRYNFAESLTFWFFCSGATFIAGILGYIPQFIWVQHRDVIRYWADWIVFGMILWHVFVVFYKKDWWSGIRCVLLAVICYFLLVYAFALLAYREGVPLELNPWQILKSIFT